MSFTHTASPGCGKNKKKECHTLFAKTSGTDSEKEKKGVRGVLIWPSLVLLQRTETPSSGSCLSVFLWLSIYSKCSTSISPLEATLRTEIYSWIAWGTNSLYHLLQLPIYFWGQSGCSLVIELKQRGTSFVPTQWPGSVSEWMLHGNGPFLFTSTGIWDRIVAPTSFH